MSVRDTFTEPTRFPPENNNIYVVDIDDCMNNPCKNDANCTDGVNDYTCKCATGYMGVNCDMSMSDQH